MSCFGSGELAPPSRRRRAATAAVTLAVQVVSSRSNSSFEFRPFPISVVSSPSSARPFVRPSVPPSAGRPVSDGRDRESFPLNLFLLQAMDSHAAGERSSSSERRISREGRASVRAGARACMQASKQASKKASPSESATTANQESYNEGSDGAAAFPRVSLGHRLKIANRVLSLRSVRVRRARRVTSRDHRTSGGRCIEKAKGEI